MKKLLVISYSHTFAQKLLVQQLVDRFKRLGADDFAEIWWDYEIPSGSGWNDEIRAKFSAADAYFVLGSDAYIESDYIRTVEWPLIESRVASANAKLFWMTVDRPAGSYGPPVNLSQFQTIGGSTTPFNNVDTPKKKNDILTLISEEIAVFLVDGAAGAAAISSIKRAPTPRQIEATYLDALRSQCAPLVNRDRYLPMHRLYVRLKADERTSDEMKAGEELMKRRIEADLANETPDFASRNRKSADEIIGEQLMLQEEPAQLPTEASARFTAQNSSGDTLEEIFQRYRFLVVRGGPGTGKTVLCWKIAEVMCAAWREEYEMRPSKVIRKITAEFGISRLPILIPIRDYAKACRQRDADVSLAGFIGHHLEKEAPGYGAFFNDFLLKQINEGRAVILLDGLDEVPAMDRHQIVESIQVFVGTFITPALIDVTGDPGDTGGNQIVITSRMAGYELAPITDDAFRHFIIRPFDEKGIEDYCRNWAEMVYRPRTPHYGKLGDDLVAAVLRESSPTVQELARNPLLLQVLCELAAPLDVTGASAPDDRLRILPRIRSEIYSQAIGIMSIRWKLAYDSVAEKNAHVRLLLEPGRMEELLSYVAFEMHRHEVLTRVTRAQLSDWLELALGKVEGIPVYAMQPGDVARTVSALIELVRTHVGIISESAPEVFQFHHLTFQEYLAGKAACRSYDGRGWKSPEELGREIASSQLGLLDQRWREPRLLAFGHLGMAARDDDTVPHPARVMTALRKSWEADDSEATPEEAALLMASLLIELPDDMVLSMLDQVVRGLVTCYKTWTEADISAENARPFIQALTRLRRRLTTPQETAGENRFDTVLADVILNTSELSVPLGRICVDRGWLTPAILRAFAEARVHDQPLWGWPFHQGLRRAVLDHDDLEPKAVAKLETPDASAAIQDRNNYERSVDAWREMKRSDSERTARPQLQVRPQVQALLSPGIALLRQAGSPLLRQVIALCGGFSDFQCARWLREYADIAYLLQQGDSVREGVISDAPEYFLSRWGSSDVIYNMAVYLDLKQDGRSLLISHAPEFSVDSICHDPSAPMLRILESSLNSRGRNVDTLALMRKLVAESAEEDVAAEAWVALLAAGHAPVMPENPVTAEKIRWHCGRIVDALRDAVLRYAFLPPKKQDPAPDANETEETLWPLLNRWLPTLTEPEAVRVFELVMRSLVEAAGEPVKHDLTWTGPAASPMNLAIMGEAWALAFAARGDDLVYRFAVALDTLKFASTPVEVFRQCEAIVKAANFRFVPAALEDIQTRPVFDSDAEALEHFCHLIHGLCEAASSIKSENSDFRAALFNEITRGVLKQPGRPPLPLMLLAEYLRAPEEDGFAMTADEFKAICEVFGDHASREYPISDPWRLADSLNRDAAVSAPAPGSELDLALNLCKSGEISDADGWKALTIFIAAFVAGRSGNKFESQEDLWHRLKAEVQNQTGALPGILGAFVTRAGNSGLVMNETTAALIEEIASFQSPAAGDALKCIIPLISHTIPSEVARLRSWLAKNWRTSPAGTTGELLERHAALLLAEHNLALEPAWIRPLLELAQFGDDRSRHRTALILGGEITALKRGIRRRPASSIGSAALEEMISCCLDEKSPLEIRQHLGYCLWDIHYDHPDSVKIFSNSKHPRNDALCALHFFFGAGTWTPEVLEFFTAWLSSSCGGWNDSFVIGYGSLIYEGIDVPPPLHELMETEVQTRKITACLLPETESYAIVIDACLKALRERDGDGSFRKASAILKSECECLREGALLHGSRLPGMCVLLAESRFQWFDTFPEDCWKELQSHVHDDRLFELVFSWLAEELKAWSEQRRAGLRPDDPGRVYSASLRNALLSILCVMTEQKRDEFVLLAAGLDQRGQSLPMLLTEAAIHHPKDRSRMAALTLLSRLPDLNAADVAHVIQSAMSTRESLRNRAIMLLPNFREFTVTTEFVDEALKKLRGNEPASLTLAYANLLTSLLGANKIPDAGKRREIISCLREAAGAPRNIRLLAHLAGSGAKKNPRVVVHDGRLDRALLALMAKSYSSFFKNV